MTKKRFTHNGIVIVDHLKKDLIYIDGDENLLDLAEYVDRLQYENEQLKKELKDYHNAFDCSQCKYQNYDWFDDGDEFEVCDKGNNESQMDNHSCTDWVEL